MGGGAFVVVNEFLDFSSLLKQNKTFVFMTLITIVIFTVHQ